jgi:hypothetical protein
MTFSFKNYVQSGRFGEVAGDAVTKAVAEARAQGLPLEGRAIDVSGETKADLPDKSTQAPVLIPTGTRAAVADFLRAKLEKDTDQAGSDLLASVTRIPKPEAKTQPALNTGLKKGQSRAA